MDYLETLHENISLHIGDLTETAVRNAQEVGMVAWDIETSGLDWKENRIGTCQLFIPNSQLYIVQINNKPRPQLKRLLSDSNVCKVFHHAMFDLRFMVHQWSVEVRNVACTKVASKILQPDIESHSLKNLLHQHLGASIDKSLQNSDWLKDHLSQEQLRYAAYDVLYLPQLLEVLHYKLMACGKWSLVEASFNFLPVQVQLEILGCTNVFQY